MISAGKLHMVAGLKLHGLDLRSSELEFFIRRYLMVAGIAAFLSALAYVGSIKIKVPEHLSIVEGEFHWQPVAFYIAISLTMVTRQPHVPPNLLRARRSSHAVHPPCSGLRAVVPRRERLPRRERAGPDAARPAQLGRVLRGGPLETLASGARAAGARDRLRDKLRCHHRLDETRRAR
jgi:hypothetical protein